MILKNDRNFKDQKCFDVVSVLPVAGMYCHADRSCWYTEFDRRSKGIIALFSALLVGSVNTTGPVRIGRSYSSVTNMRLLTLE